MKVFYKFSIYELVLLVGIFLMVLGVFSLKTIYYFSYQNIVWLIYLVALTVLFSYAVYYACSGKSYCFIVLLLIATLIGYMPYEEEYIRVVELINNPIENLSALAQKIPFIIGVCVDIFLYPLLIVLSLMVLYVMTRKHRLNKSSLDE